MATYSTSIYEPEPSLEKIRTMVLDSVSQFKTTAISNLFYRENSPFFKEVQFTISVK
jgi:hypothetical protein